MKSTVTGYSETARAIRKLAQFPRKQVGQASRKALKPINDAAKRNLKSQGSYKRGVLLRSMRVRLKKGTSISSEWIVTPTGRGVPIAHLVEAGTRPHYQPKRGIMHPGAEAKPFLEPAYFAYDTQAVEIMVKEMGLDLIRYSNQVAYRGK